MGLLEPQHRVDVVQVVVGAGAVEHLDRPPFAVLGHVLDQRLAAYSGPMSPAETA